MALIKKGTSVLLLAILMVMIFFFCTTEAGLVLRDGSVRSGDVLRFVHEQEFLGEFGGLLHAGDAAQPARLLLPGDRRRSGWSVNDVRLPPLPVATTMTTTTIMAATIH
ncbi:hypothetical protein ACP4OV_002294 [Aristida adscensionis]